MLRTRNWLRKALSEPQVRPASRGERGQAIILIAVAMIGLIAFVGLTVDSGILFIGEGHLRRAVDAAALAAAAQFRVNRTSDQMYTSAEQVVHMNGVDPTTLVLGICLDGDPHNDNDLCPGPGAPQRKLVKITATTRVTFAFLGIIGFPNLDITADATTEAASVDVVLVIDTSNSMTFDQAGTPLYDPAVCNNATPPDPADQAAGYKGYCLPFHYVKTAAVNFINNLYFPYDRLSIVTFDAQATVQIPLASGLDKTQITDWVKGNGVAGIGNGVDGLRVSFPLDPGYVSSDPAHPFSSPCTWAPPGQPDPSKCTNTSTGGGLKLAGGQFGIPPIRQDAVWVVILLTDGAANASEADPGVSGSTNRFCPQATWTDQASISVPPVSEYDPFCRDYDKTTRHTLLDPRTYITAGIDLTHTSPYNPGTTFDPSGLHYDADDYARDYADFVSCSPKLATAAKYCRDSLNYAIGQGGQGALLFGIGLGALVINNAQGGGIPCSPPSAGCELRIAPGPTAGYDAGDALLRYIGNVGADGDPDPTVGPDPCLGVAPPALVAQPDPKRPTLPAGNLSYNCGNYYFAQYGTGLTSVFQSIASRVFTRLTQ